MTQFNVALIATAAKIALYLYFIEKIYIISVPKTSRMQTHLYLLSLGLLLPSLAIIIIQIVFRINVVSVNYPFHCTVGLELPASIVSLGYDALLTIMYSAIFMKFYFFPTAAQQTAPHSSSLHMMAKRNAIAAIIASFTICVNYIILLCLNGSERGLVASSSTSLALTITCAAIHWVTTHPAESQLNEKALRANGDKPYRLEIKQHQEVVVLTEFNKA
ncbi:hypothetical protein G6F57_002688 [Rhizopus arrhizus]|uniref:Uncharacterized protein n=1 Tax=Rhizopus oryzae TaxID=64495 RepID=A0A9P7BQI6_RHIOR|nr:hypothetical protein G6F23_005007 [Rhizopus arrhizus]KAG1418254.1 hypothetical protein G6F58_005136 [Rhizopus delemar]KAG0763402.1 hypothetical protein G6F24_006045 [Rhizopus arrhizus]KAG0794324.1 hypothetical protein G6F21_002949 [Rhizopus arrhizus]KAG0808996.1 hypothetical protein G6F20_009126 [Rhizopus arrhizus]